MPFGVKIILILSLLGLAGCWPAQAQQSSPPPREILIVYSGQALGELKPCGCAREEDQGGIERRMGYFKTALPQGIPVIRVDLGDNFKEASRQGLAKAETLARALHRMNYDAVVLGEKDLVYGVDFIRNLPPLPWTSANLRLPGWEVPAYRLKTLAGGVRVALVSVADPKLFYSGPHGHVKTRPPREVLRDLLPTLRRKERPDLVVLLTHMERGRALDLLSLDGVDVVINGHIRDENHLVDFQPVEREGKLFLQPAPRGQKMGELRVILNPDGTRNYRTRMVKLDSTVPADPEMTELYAQYDAKIEALFLESLERKRRKKRSVYATQEACRTCHAAAHAVWAESRHARAYATLKKVNKAFDPECLACHTTGFNRPGGFISEVDTPELENVQCEVCHGPRREHAKEPRRQAGPDPRQACGRCHVRNHSPNFKYETYWPRIAHGPGG